MTKLAAQMLLKQPIFPHVVIDMGENSDGATIFLAGYNTTGRNIEDTLCAYDGGLSEELLAAHSGLVEVNELPSGVARKATMVANSQSACEKQIRSVQNRIIIPGAGGP